MTGAVFRLSQTTWFATVACLAPNPHGHTPPGERRGLTNSYGKQSRNNLPHLLVNPQTHHSVRHIFDWRSAMDDTEFEAFEAPYLEISGEPGIGITLYPAAQIGGVWLSWDEAVAMHKWLSALVDAAKASNARPA